MRDEIKNIISGYCQGERHLEFCVDDFDAMIAEIKQAVFYQIDNCESKEEAKSRIEFYL